MIGIGIRIGNSGKGVKFPKEHLMYSQLFNNPFSLNSGASLNFVQVSNHKLIFEDLTGITIVSQVGTANMYISGNNILPTNDGNLLRLELSDGSIFNCENSIGTILLSNNLVCEIDGATWVRGVSNGWQTFLNSWNSDFHFDGTKGVRLNVALGNVWEIEQDCLIENNDIFIGNAADGYFIISSYLGNYRFWIFTGGVRTIVLSNTPIENGRHKIRFAVNADNTSAELFVDDVSVASTNSLNSGNYTGSFIGIMSNNGTSDYTNGVVFNFRVNSTNYNTQNNWMGEYRTPGVFNRFIVGGAQLVDNVGRSFSRSAIANTYNCNGYNENYSRLENTAGSIIDTSADITVNGWVKVPDGIVENYVLSNGTLQVTVDDTNIYFSRDGGSTFHTLAHNTDDFFYFAFTCDSLGNSKSYKGESLIEPVFVSNSSITVNTSISNPMYQANNVANTNGVDGYICLNGVYSEVLVLADLIKSWKYNKSNFSGSGLPYELPFEL